MSSAERTCQNKIQNLEIQLIKLFPNVHSRKQVEKVHIEDMTESSRGNRKKKEDGFYMFTIDLKTKESHGILIYKETQHDGKIIFYIYEPNGKKNFNNGYTFTIRLNEKDTLNLDMCPIKSINDGGDCALWCIIAIILWNSFGTAEERWAALDLFHTSMRSDSAVRNDFMAGILSLLKGKNFDTQSETKQFVEEVSRRINDLRVIVD
jgi:hypothetical protein